MSANHALLCKTGDLLHIRHDHVGKEFKILLVCVFSQGAVLHKPYIYGVNCRSGNAITGEEPTSTNPFSTNPAPQQPPQQPQQHQQKTQQPQEEESTSDIDEKCDSVGVCGFYRYHRCHKTIFDVQITDTPTYSNRNTDHPAIPKCQEKEKKDEYRDAYLEMHMDFYPLVYSVLCQWNTWERC